VAQVVEHLPSKCKALVQTPVLPNTKTKTQVEPKEKFLISSDII
jgi:hypothetical protein